MEINFRYFTSSVPISLSWFQRASGDTKAKDFDHLWTTYQKHTNLYESLSGFLFWLYLLEIFVSQEFATDPNKH